MSTANIRAHEIMNSSHLDTMRCFNNLNAEPVSTKDPADKLSPRVMLGVKLNILRPHGEKDSPQALSPKLLESPGSSSQESSTRSNISQWPTSRTTSSLVDKVSRFIKP